jgi:hypothetical protein
MDLDSLTYTFKLHIVMKTCESCGNDYEKAIEITVAGKPHWFDSFECAIHKLARTCARCDCKVIGHGVCLDGEFFCSAHCANQPGIRELRESLVTKQTGVLLSS